MKLFKRCSFVLLFLGFVQLFLLILSTRVLAGRYIDGGVDIYHDFGRYKIRTTEGDYEDENVFTITDDSTFIDQPYDTINLHDTIGWYRYDLLLANMKTLVLIFQIDICEVDDGYQEFYIFSKANNGKPVLHFSYTDFEHGPGKKDSSYTRYEFYCELVIDDIGDEIYIGYEAHGSSSDTWKNKNLEFQMGMSKEEQKKPGLYWIVNGVN